MNSMRILLTGATGYIGKRLLTVLVKSGHRVVCLVRDKNRFHPPADILANIVVYEGDLLKAETLQKLPKDLDAAYYLVHSMSGAKDYADLEQASARNFVQAVSETDIQQVIYLSGIVNQKSLSKHLESRKQVERILALGPYHLTTLRAGIVIGSGSASFEIIRDLVEKLPVMVAPKWLMTRCQPIGIQDVLHCLTGCLLHKAVYDRDFDIGGSDVLNYKEMLFGFAQIRKLRRHIWTVPLMTPRLSSYWLYFVTSTSYNLARSLVDSMHVEVVCRNDDLNQILGIQPQSYKEALKQSFATIQADSIESSWHDANISSGLSMRIADYISVPEYGCYKDVRNVPLQNSAKTLENIWSIGGETGWYYGNWLWQLRGILDKVVGGVGLRRGRTRKSSIYPGDTLDFWRVLYADRKEGRLLLFAEMRLPGEAWLEFMVKDDVLTQTATFRPLGLAGRLYWYLVSPLHAFVFGGMSKRLAA